MRLRFDLPPQGTLKPNDADDPLPYYYHPWVGWLYKHRLQMGLDMLPASGETVLEVGVGSGVLVPTLSKRYRRYTGTDLKLAPGLEGLVAPGCDAHFVTADLLDPTSLPEAAFDAIVCFSVLEHIAAREEAARQLARALKPGGTLVTGYPMVSRLMTGIFKLVGFATIDDHHVSPPRAIEAALDQVLERVDTRSFPPAVPVDVALYRCAAWRRRPTA